MVRQDRRFPNGTNWGLRGSLNVSKHFDPRDDSSPAWRPGGYFERAWGGDWRSPWINAGRNWSALVPEITYMKTRALTDDKDWDGFEVLVKWKGGSRNSYLGYGARPVLVDSIRVPNPYAIATLYNYATESFWGRWVFPTTPLANNKLLVYVHSADRIEIDIDTNGDGTRDFTRVLTGAAVIQKTLEITGAADVEMNDADSDGVWDFVEITPRGFGFNWMTLNIVENRTDPWVDYTNVTAIQIDQALVTVKKHDSFDTSFSRDGFIVIFAGETGVLDFNADGLDLQTGIEEVQVNSGPCEIEIWPGAPGDNQQRILLSCQDVTIWYGTRPPPIQRGNFTGTVLIYGAALDIELSEREEQEWSDDTQTGDVTVSLSSLDARPRFPSPLGPSGGRPATGYPTGTLNDLFFGAGVVFETLPKSAISTLDLEGEHYVGLTTILPGTGRVGLYKGWWRTGTTAVVGFTGTVEAELRAGESIEIWSKVVPLDDFNNDDRDYDDWIFGGYDDFALTGSGIVYITAWVHDIAFKIVDNMNNPLPAARTTVTLTGGSTGTMAVPKSGGGGDPDRLVGGLQFSYRIHGDGWAVFYQLPGDHYYGVTVTFDGSVVYENPTQIMKLIKTEMIPIVTSVVKAKFVFVDCNGLPVAGAWVRYTDPSGRTVVTKITDFGELDLGMTAGGTMVIRGLWWKGIWVPFDQARDARRELPLGADGSLTVVLDRNIDSPITLRAVINDFIFTPWDYNMDNRIPRLNITLMWVGVAPTTGERLYFVQTLDPTGDTWDGNLPGNDPSDDNNPRNDYNTSVNLHQWFSYKIEYRQGDVTTSRGLKTYGRVQYIFYQMPPTYYNITVTTTPHLYRGGHRGEDWGTPATSKWPGRTDAPVEYEAKILWGSPDASAFTTADLRNPPLEAWRRASYSAATGRWSFTAAPDGTWAAYANDRIVLRVFGTIGGRPVTDPDLNPGRVGNQTARICGPRSIDLLTWAHTFNKRVVDGDFDYLADARRIGNATFNIRNDNGIWMEEYYPATQTFSTDFTSSWTRDLLDTTWLKADSQFSSTIWWNGSYRAENLRFINYFYPLEFTRGEEPWARFYNRVGLTGTGILTTEDG
ncbi:MAG: hypothetical protein RMK31_07970, partial [Candidatus Caldarchaeum sp.]|nr:hypothetical protein [Candidatus Caldarchaeum sp.]